MNANTHTSWIQAFRWLVGLALALSLAAPASQVRAGAGNGTTAAPEPVLVSNLREGSGDSSPSDLAAIGSTLFFAARDGIYGREIWKTNPPYNSIQLVADICSGGCSSSPNSLARLGDTLFFAADDGQSGMELWRSEPPYTQATTFRVADINPGGPSNPAQLTPIGTSVFFSAEDDTTGEELWRTDPPYTNAFPIEDIFPGPGGSNPSDLTSIGWMLFFAADDSTGTELWRSDPPYNAASTFRVVDINPDGSAAVRELTPMDLKLFFSAENEESGRELWMVESPYLEARRVTDILGTPLSSDPTNLYAVDDILFFTASLGFNGAELRKSRPPYDPTTTFLVEDINEGFFGSYPDHKTAIGDMLFFTANDGVHGVELWRSEPEYNPDDTHLVLDIREGPASSDPQALLAVGTTLFFTANEGEFGTELWKSAPPYDEESTTRISDVFRGSGGSDPHSIFPVDSTVFFAATDETDGKELYRYGGLYGIPETGFAPAVVTHLPPQPAAKRYAAMDDLTLEVPELGINAPVVGVPVSPEGWDLDWLDRQVGYLSGTAFPTWAGNTVLTAHVTLPSGLPGPFARLGEIQWGDQIFLYAWGQRYIYEVRSIDTVQPEEHDAVFQHEELDWITLVTCQNYDPQQDIYRERLVVRAVLVKVEPIP